MDAIDTLVSTATQGLNIFGVDSAALMTIYFFDALRRANSQMKLEYAANHLTSCICVEHICGTEWAERSLIGYFDYEQSSALGGTFVYEPNAKFVETFTKRLDSLLASDADDFVAADLRDTLYAIAVRGYFGYEGSVLQTYDTVAHFIGMTTRGEVITEDHMRGEGYRNYAFYPMLLPQHDITSGTQFTVNVVGLNQFCDMIESLGFGLSDREDFKQIAARIRAL
jgi:hypothetical protein